MKRPEPGPDRRERPYTQKVAMSSIKLSFARTIAPGPRCVRASRSTQESIMKFRLLAAASAIMCAVSTNAAPVLAPPPPLGPEVQPFVHVPAGRIAITHLRIIDGTGVAPVDDATLLIDGEKIGALLPSGAAVPAGYRVLDGTGETAMPGLVGMHNHMFYIARPNLDASGHSDAPLVVPQMTFSAPRLYLANGVTTMRTTGSVEPYADLNVKR